VADPLKSLGRAIRKKRKELGLTQEQLAEKADLHWTFISGVERGVRNISILKLFRIAHALNKQVRDLVDDF
jgi:transcriptional regulator with XRE-family HTH domain